MDLDVRYEGKERRNYVMLSIDGGGIRGLIPATTLIEVEKMLQTKRGDNFLVRGVARATSAAPTYFEPAFPESLDTIPNATPGIDGGVFASNPTACAYVEALVKGRGIGHGVPPEEIAILSLGTGRKPETITLKQRKESNGKT